MNFYTCYLHAFFKKGGQWRNCPGYVPGGGGDRGLSKRVFMRINLTAILLAFVFLNVSAGVSAQRISLRVKNVPLKVVFEEIKKQTGYFFWYEDDLLKGTSKVSVNLSNVGLEEGLDACMKGQPLTYSIKDKVIVVKAKEVSLKDKVMGFFKGVAVSGKVVDEKGVALPGVNVRLKGSAKMVVTDKDGNYSIEVPDAAAVLQFSFVGYQVTELPAGSSPLVVTLRILSAQLEDVSVVNTGYQSLPKERATGSFVQIDNELLNRRVSTNILDRLDGITSGLIFNGTASRSINTLPTTNKNLGISIRGESTILSSKDPLIVVDNFPYEGDIRNINPNDVESVTILKDAAAASIWGAKAGNGVIVITTKKGKLNERMHIELNTNLTIANKPDLFKDKNYLSSPEFIEVEKYLFDKGFFNADITNVTAQTPLSPVVDLLAKQRALPAIDLAGRSAIDAQINALGQNDVRNDFEKYVYQKAVSQQYSLGIRGGGKDISYALSVGYDKNKDAIVRNGYDRLSINTFNTYTPIKNLEITAGLNYSLNNTQLNNQNSGYGGTYAIGSKYLRMLPYANLIDENGNAAVYTRGYKQSYLTQTAANGFLDWNYRPLDELQNTDNTTKINDILFRTGVKYKFTSYLNAEVNYQNEHQIITGNNFQSQDTYFTRDLINKYSQYNTATKAITYIFPLGGIMNTNNYDWNANSVRGQINYNQTIKEHQMTALIGAEVRQTSATGYGTTSYGFDPQFGTSTMNLNYNTSYPLNPSGTGTITAPDGSILTYLNRFISYYANAAYTFQDKYILNISGRKDGSNIFGANINNRITPLWSAGLGWNVSKEDFYKVDWLPYLKLRATYGYNGNIGNSSALLTGRFLTNSVTGTQYVNIITAPNPELRWERVKNINLGLDFASKNGVINGTIELYQKDGVDLLQPTPLAPQTGFTTFSSNAASTRTRGIDITLQAKIISGAFNWNATLLSSFIKDKLLKYDVKQTSASIQTTGGAVALVGKPMYSIFSYKWAGLDPTNGDPQGYLNGKVSKDYTAIQNNFNPDSLIFNGSARPTAFGSLRNDFSYKGFSLSFNITYKLGYYFRKPTVKLNYQDILTQFRNSDYSIRWQKPGDEEFTNVPSLVYPSNTARNNFYQYADVLVERADHIRLQDVRLGYTFSKHLIKGIDRLQIYTYANNLGILWRENKQGIDPDFYSNGSISVVPNPFSFSLGLNANF